jgi:dihydroorotate dehydrogenase
MLSRRAFTSFRNVRDRPCSTSHSSNRAQRPSLLRALPSLPFQAQIRHASTTAQPTIGSRLVNFFYGTTLLLGLGIVYVYITDTRASAHRWIVIPALRLLYRDPEQAHHAGNQALKALWAFGLYPRERGDPDLKQDLAIDVFGHTLRNPIATSAGIDKHANIPDPLFAIGPAIIELGGATPMPQDGNEKPRVFRLTSQNAMINRYGLNSEGADYIAMRLRKRVREFAHSLGLGHDDVAEKHILDGGAGVPPGSLTQGKLLAVNIAKNKTTPQDDVEAVTNDYVYCVDRLAPYADILVVNVSSPNTPGLRALQQSDILKKILTGVVRAAKSVDRTTKPAVMVKVSPDEDSDEQIAGICDAVWGSGVDGVIVGNTTNRRPGPLPHLKNLSPLEEQTLLEQGGFSGPHLFERTKDLVRRYKKLLTDKPEDVELPQRSRGALEAEAEEVKTSIGASTGATPASNPDRVTASIDTGAIPPTNISDKPDAEKQPLFQLPGQRFYDEPQEEQDALKAGDAAMELAPSNPAERARLKSILDALERLPTKEQISTDRPKVIFATGGITNGKQALEVIEAGADVAMVYTALVYGGIGTISRIKDEIRAEKKRKSKF